MNKLFSKLTAATGISILILSIGIIIPINSASAQSAGGIGQGLEIAPPVIILRADPGQTITTEINIRDVTNGDLIVTGEINDFVASGEDGTPKLILDETEINPYSIKNWISPLPQLTLKSKQILPLKAVINVPADAAPGGYYGVIRFTGTAPELEGTGVSLSASLGSLILLTVNGTAKEELSISDFSVNYKGKTGSLFETTPLQFVEKFKNTGNIHENPTGQISITDMFGNKIANVNVNLEMSNVLPGSTRKYEQPLDSKAIGNKILFGRYTADLKITYGANKTVLNKTIEFWVIPYTAITIGIIVIIASFMGLKYAIKRYNNHIIAMSQSHKKKK